MILVSVIVPCLNEKLYITKLLNNINLLVYNFNLEVVVSDGGSDDGTIDLLKQFRTTKFSYKYILHSKKYVSFSLNKAIKESNGSIIVRMDVHTEYEKHYISNCVNVLQSNDVQCVGGPWRAHHKNFIQESLALAFQSKLSAGGALSRDLNFTGIVDTVYLGCWYKSDLIKFGLFDEDLVRNQDDELCHRIRSNGGFIYQDSSIKSFYYPRSNYIKLYKQYFQYGYWRYKTLLKFHDRVILRHFFPFILVIVTFVNVVLLFTSYNKISFIYFLGYFLLFGFSLFCKVNIFKIHTLFASLFAIFIMHHSYGIGFLTAFISKSFNNNFNFAFKLTR
jgi:succinoglycan biosynthesis protein ExoA